MNINKLTT